MISSGQSSRVREAARRANTVSMIIDCYTHVWEHPGELGRCIPSKGKAAGLGTNGEAFDRAGLARHLAAAETVSATFVLGFKSRYLGADIPNETISAYVRTHPGRLIGFAGVDLTFPRAAIAEVRRTKSDLGLAGVALAPAAQDFHPSSGAAMQFYAEAAGLGLPVLFHTGVFTTASTKLEYARPVLLDEVAREFPDLRIVIAHLGYPWMHETIVLLAKHANVYAEISGLLAQPWQAYQALLSAWQMGVISKLLFGSGFPNGSPAQCIEELYGINHLCQGTNLPPIPREQLRGIVERDALTALRIPVPAGMVKGSVRSAETDEES